MDSTNLYCTVLYYRALECLDSTQSIVLVPLKPKKLKVLKCIPKNICYCNDLYYSVLSVLLCPVPIVLYCRVFAALCYYTVLYYLS